MSNSLVRLDGVTFSANNSRFSFEKQARPNFELAVAGQFESGSIPSDAGFYVKAAGDRFRVVQGTIGQFPLGECLLETISGDSWIYVEERESKLIVVLCRAGEITADLIVGLQLSDTLIAELAGLDAPFDVISLHEVPPSFDNQLPKALIRNRKSVTESLIDSIDLDSDFKLIKWNEAVRTSGIFIAETYTKWGLVVVLICIGMYIFWPEPQKMEQIDPVLVEKARMEAEYQSYLHSPSISAMAVVADDLLNPIANELSWNLRELTLDSDGHVSIIVDSAAKEMPMADELVMWANLNGYQLKFGALNSASLMKTVELSPVIKSDINYKKAQDYLGILLGDGLGVTISFAEPVSLDVYKYQEVNIGMDNILLSDFSNEIETVDMLPISADHLMVRPSGYFYTVRVAARLVSR